MLQGLISMHINAELYLSSLFFSLDAVCLSGLNKLAFFANLPLPEYIPVVAALHVLFMEQ